jgi:hypothetical protein
MSRVVGWITVLATIGVLAACGGGGSSNSSSKSTGVGGPSEIPTKAPAAPSAQATPAPQTTATTSGQGASAPYEPSAPASAPVASAAFRTPFQQSLKQVMTVNGNVPSDSRMNAIVDCIIGKFQAQGLTTNLAVGNADNRQREGDIDACSQSNP